MHSHEGEDMIGDYNGVTLSKRDTEVLRELETQVGKIPQLPQVEPETFGFAVMNQRVTALGLYNKGLTYV